MKIEFKKESLFDRFSIPTKTTKSELMRLFQTKPELRKELPIFIQTINSEQKLFIDELFSTYIDNNFYTFENYIQEIKDESISISLQKQTAALVNLVKNFETAVTKVNISGKVLNSLIMSVINCNDISTFYHVNFDSSKEVFDSFVSSVTHELKEKINVLIKTLDSKVANSLNRIINSLSDSALKKELQTAFISALCLELETLTLRVDDKELLSSGICFINGLTDTIFTNKEIYPAFKFSCNKLFNSIDVFEDVGNITKVLGRLKNEDLKSIIDDIINKCLTYVLFENINKSEYENITTMGNLLETIVEIIQTKEIEIENTNILNILIVFRDNGKDWYNDYKNLVNNINNKRDLSASILSLARMINNNSALKKNKILFTNLILRASNYEYRIDSFFREMNQVSEKIEIQFSYNEFAKVAAFRALLTEKQSVMISLILDYYGITILEPSLVNIFDKIYELLIDEAKIATAKNFMKRCDSLRGVYREYKNPVEQSKTQAPSYNRQYSPSYSSGCYIASCVYGSYDCPQVWMLRRYRDNHLGSSKFGRLFIKIYYKISPILVKMFGKTKWFKAIWKKYLDKKIKKLTDAGYENTPYLDKKWH